MRKITVRNKRTHDAGPDATILVLNKSIRYAQGEYKGHMGPNGRLRAGQLLWYDHTQNAEKGTQRRSWALHNCHKGPNMWCKVATGYVVGR